MTTYYLDSSAWIKRYFREAGSDEVARVFGGGAGLVSSRLAVAEVVAGVVRRARHERIDETLIKAQLGQVLQDSEEVLLIEFDEVVMNRAAQTAGKHGLRGADSVHLASAIVYREMHQSDDVVVMTSDAELIAASLQEGLQVLDPRQPVAQ